VRLGGKSYVRAFSNSISGAQDQRIVDVDTRVQTRQNS